MYACSNLELRLTSAIIASLGLILAYKAAPISYMSHLCVVLFLWIFLAEWRLFFKPTSWRYWLYGALYLLPPCISLIALNQCAETRFLLPLICILTFGADGGAYFFGKLWGKKKLCPTISPNKTWVGLAGAYITTGTAILVYQMPTTTQHAILLLVLSSISTTLAVMGDLFESWLKRKANLKDSGEFLPGHGGALDRIDSLIPVSIFFYCAQNWILPLVQN